MTKVQDPGHPGHLLSPRVAVVTRLSIGLNAKKKMFFLLAELVKEAGIYSQTRSSVPVANKLMNL